MHDREKPAFRDLMTATAAYYDRKLVPQTIAIYWQGLADLTLDQVRAALNAHAQDATSGQFMPKIADIRRQIEVHRDDGHPGAEEAWSIALGARDENASVVWTEQISQAFFVAAMPLLDEGDKIAARRAFLERYERELAEARKAGVVAKWVASLGSDPHQREQAVERAVRLGRIDVEHAHKLLPHSDPAPPNMRAIENGVRSASTSAEEAKARTAALRAMLRLP